MTSVAIFYFSGTGNTWWLGKALERKFNERNIQTQFIEIDSEFVTQYIDRVDAFDIVGFGYPIYGSDCPLKFWSFLNTLPLVEKKDSFVFTSMLAFSGDGALVAERHLKKRGFNLKQAVNIKMPNNLKLPYPIIDQFPIYSEEETEQILMKAEKKIERLIDKIINRDHWIEGRGPLGILGGVIQRGSVVLLGWSRWARNFFVDNEACTQCMLCVDDCPTGNIRYEDGEFVWGEKCICCLRCYNLCPIDAIQYKKATLDRDKFQRYKGPISGYNTLMQKNGSRVQ